VKKSWYISRRTLLQTAGASIALPALEAMIKPGARAATVAPPRRFLAVHGQVYGYVGRTDPELNTFVAPWTRPVTGYEVALENNTHLRPFFNRNINSKITVLTGVTDRVMIGTHDSPVKIVANTYPIAMYRGGCVVLTTAPGDSTTVGPPPQPDPFNGATADQIAARYLGQFTPVPSLSLSIEPIGGNYYAFPMSMKSATEPVPTDKDPLSVFNRLFAGYDPQATLEEIQRRAHYRKSVIDGVRSQAARLNGRLGRSDQLKLDSYLESVRSLERLIEQAGAEVPVGVTAPSSSYANNELRQKAMQELIVQAFVTDRTRVVALSGQFSGGWLHFRGPGQETLDYSQFRSFNGQALNNDHHTMSHYDQGLNGGAPTPDVTAYKQDHMEIFTHWALEMYADLLGKLDSYMDSDGVSTVLDNTFAVYGGDDSDSARHGYMSMPCILGGRGGATASGSWRIKAGRQLRFGAGGSTERSWKDLLWGAMNIVGVPDPNGSPQLTSFGYAKQPLDGALAV
jgi:hypothetical protein